MKKKKSNQIVCRCEELEEKDIIKAIKSGADNLDAVKRMTRAGMGLCQGRTCGHLIAKIIARETGKPLSEIFPITSRVPVRPISIKILEEKGGK